MPVLQPLKVLFNDIKYGNAKGLHNIEIAYNSRIIVTKVNVPGKLTKNISKKLLWPHNHNYTRFVFSN